MNDCESTSEHAAPRPSVCRAREVERRVRRQADERAPRRGARRRRRRLRPRRDRPEILRRRRGRRRELSIALRASLFGALRQRQIASASSTSAPTCGAGGSLSTCAARPGRRAARARAPQQRRRCARGCADRLASDRQQREQRRRSSRASRAADRWGAGRRGGAFARSTQAPSRDVGLAASWWAQPATRWTTDSRRRSPRRRAPRRAPRRRRRTTPSTPPVLRLKRAAADGEVVHAWTVSVKPREGTEQTDIKLVSPDGGDSSRSSRFARSWGLRTRGRRSSTARRATTPASCRRRPTPRRRRRSGRRRRRSPLRRPARPRPRPRRRRPLRPRRRRPPPPGAGGRRVGADARRRIRLERRCGRVFSPTSRTSSGSGGRGRTCWASACACGGTRTASGTTAPCATPTP